MEGYTAVFPHKTREAIAANFTYGASRGSGRTRQSRALLAWATALRTRPAGPDKTGRAPGGPHHAVPAVEETTHTIYRVEDGVDAGWHATPSSAVSDDALDAVGDSADAPPRQTETPRRRTPRRRREVASGSDWRRRRRAIGQCADARPPQSKPHSGGGFRPLTPWGQSRAEGSAAASRPQRAAANGRQPCGPSGGGGGGDRRAAAHVWRPDGQSVRQVVPSEGRAGRCAASPAVSQLAPGGDWVARLQRQSATARRRTMASRQWPMAGRRRPAATHQRRAGWPRRDGAETRTGQTGAGDGAACGSARGGGVRESPLAGRPAAFGALQLT